MMNKTGGIRVQQQALARLRAFLPPPKSSEVAIALMIARAVGSSVRDRDKLRRVLHRPAPLIVLKVPVPGFERHCGRVLEDGLIMPFRLKIKDLVRFGGIADDLGSRRDEKSRRDILVLAGKQIPSIGERSLSRMLSDAVQGQPATAVLVIDQTDGELPDIVLRSADLVLEGPHLDQTLMAELLQICCGIVPKHALAEMNKQRLTLVDLHLDDVVLVARPGKSLAEIISAFKAIVERAEAENADGESGKNAKSARSGDKSHGRDKEKAGDKNRDKAVPPVTDMVDVIMPEPQQQAETETAQPTVAGADINANARSDAETGTGIDPNTPKDAEQLASTDNEPSDQTPDQSQSQQAEKRVDEAPTSAASRAIAKRGVRPLRVETLHGYGEATNWATDLKSDLRLWRDGALDWSELSTRLLLSGPPGTGKTTFARALCNSLQVPLLATSVARWLEASYLGDVLQAMAGVFKLASERKPAILFIDEIDNIGSRMGGGSGRSGKHDDYWSSVVNRLLELLDGAAKTEGVIIVAATNLPGKIDPALLRSGRLERHIEIPKPDLKALTGILAHHLGTDLAKVIETAPVKMDDIPDWGGRPGEESAVDLESDHDQSGDLNVRPDLDPDKGLDSNKRYCAQVNDGAGSRSFDNSGRSQQRDGDDATENVETGALTTLNRKETTA
ncbi:AAA family ATPase [Peteryoungia desertarenae]|uniref:AAA family ATPase n=2 Tax=Peteryoungia desertarenae TaxID=1813451 RepID=A0ABX6QRU9_9HYPH|nr:AAA family ATPase [Peteryoungia desertarenae]